MTSAPDPDASRRGIGKRLFRGRRPGPLLGPWLTSAAFAAIIYGVETNMPALHHVVGPLYWLLLGISLIATWRWLRARSSNRRTAERRHGERRGSGES